MEHANVFGFSYGTLKKEVILKIEKGIDIIVDIDWQGTRQIQKSIYYDSKKPNTVKTTGSAKNTIDSTGIKCNFYQD